MEKIIRWQKVVVSLSHKILPLFFDIKITNTLKFHDLKGPLLILSNHKSYIDHFLLALALSANDRLFPLRFLARADFLSNRFLGGMFKNFGSLPANWNGFLNALKILKKGGVVVAYPEGGINLRHGVNPLKEGVAKLARLSYAPVLPAAISGIEGFSILRTLINPLTYLQILTRRKKIIYVAFGPIFYTDKNIPENITLEEIRNRLLDIYNNPRN